MVHFFGIPCQIPVGKADCQKDTVQTATYAFAMALAWTIGYKIPLEELPLRSRDSNFPTWIWASCRAHYNSLLSSKLYLEEYQPPRPYATTHYNIAIILTHLDGTQFNILEYIQGNDDHTQFRPWIDITTYIQLGHFFKEGSRWEWSADSEVEVTLHINPQQLRDDIIAIFVGILSYTSESIFVKYLFAQKIEDGTYNLVGNGSRLEWDPERPPNRDLRTAAFLDRHFSDGWRTDTVRLV